MLLKAFSPFPTPLRKPPSRESASLGVGEVFWAVRPGVPVSPPPHPPSQRNRVDPVLSAPGEDQAFAQEAEKQGCRVGVEITENFAACFLGEGCWSKKKKKNRES